MNYDNVAYKFGDLWAAKFKDLIESQEFDNIFLQLRKVKESGKTIVPQSQNLFRAFSNCDYSNLRVVIIGQDPYFTMTDGKIVADGIAFSCSITDKEQPSLFHLKSGIEKDCYNGLNLTETRDENDLVYLSKQGVLLLNSALTTELGKPGMHVNLWRPFMEYLITEILNKYNRGLVFILMGAQAQRLEKFIDEKAHYVFKTSHPASASYAGNVWDSGGVFSKTNEILERNNGEDFKIVW